MISIAIADDHLLFRKGLITIINSFPDCTVVAEGVNGEDLLKHLGDAQIDLALLDVNMPVMNGAQTATAIADQYPDIKIMALSMMDDESSVIKMIKSGARGYLLKDASTTELKQAIDDMMLKGYHINEMADGRMFERLSSTRDAGHTTAVFINPREQEFLKWVITELTYKEIASEMNVSPRTVDGYREALFEKLQLKSRIGLAMYALKQGFASIK